MNAEISENLLLPSASQVCRAVRLYLKHAYPSGVPERAERFIPPEDFDVAAWLMSDLTERRPSDASLESVSSFALRIGNEQYQHMKLRITRPPNSGRYLFCVDSHDGFLSARPGTADGSLLEQLKRFNASVAHAIMADWDSEGLPTEHNYLRDKIRQARIAKDSG